jgi:hypothetical protein
MFDGHGTGVPRMLMHFPGISIPESELFTKNILLGSVDTSPGLLDSEVLAPPPLGTKSLSIRMRTPNFSCDWM